MSGYRGAELRPGTVLSWGLVMRQDTRELLRIPRPFCTRYKKCFAFLGYKFYNLPPMSVRNRRSMVGFKNKLKKWLLSLTLEELKRFDEVNVKEENGFDNVIRMEQIGIDGSAYWPIKRETIEFLEQNEDSWERRRYESGTGEDVPPLNPAPCSMNSPSQPTTKDCSTMDEECMDGSELLPIEHVVVKPEFNSSDNGEDDSDREDWPSAEDPLAISMEDAGGKTKFTCPTCSKEFTDQPDIERHLLTHTGYKPFLCTICLKRFAWKCLLKEHIMQHTGEKPHLCTVCSKSFLRPSHLKRHLSSSHIGANEALLAATKDVAKARGYQFVWVRLGKIYARKTPDNKCIGISTEKDLFKLK